MTIKRMDHVTLVVDDMATAVAYFTALGLALEGRTSVEGATVDRLCGLDGCRADIAMLKTPDGHGRIELTRYRQPAAVSPEPAIAPPNTLGLRQIMFEVDDLEATVARMQAHGAVLVGEIVQYEHVYKLCYLRGPAGIIVALAEALA